MRKSIAVILDALAFIAIVGITVIAILLCGCTRNHVETLADLKAGAEAVRQATPEAKGKIADALSDLILAELRNAPDLPAPRYSASEIAASPALLGKVAEKAQANPPKYQSPPPPPVNPLHGILTTAGTWMVYVGIALISAAALLFGLSFWPIASTWIAPFIPWIEEAAIVGGMGLGIGSCFLWLSANTWIMYVAAGIAGMWALIRYRKAWVPAVWYLFHPRPRKPSSPTTNKTQP